jgi:hypothetical protein
MASINKTFLAQIDKVLKQYDSIYTEYDDFSDVSFDDYGKFRTSVLAVIDRVAGPDSIYAVQAKSLPIDQKNFRNNMKHLPILVGIVRAMRDDVKNGYLNTARELFHGELFSDFLEMSDFLLGEGFKDAAAVMAGGVLESHLRQLCIKHGINVLDAAGKSRKAAQFNDDLYKAKVYSLVDQKSITAWLDIRNKAAHAKYQEYSKDHVSVMILGIRGFIARCPA